MAGLGLVWQVALLASALVVANIAYLAWYIRWETRHTAGMAYFGKSLTERRALKRRMRLYSAPAMPAVRLLARINSGRASMPSFEYEGVHGPSKVSSPAVFARAKEYQPRSEDVFVVTQMRCGTTWMQQVVYEIATRGHGDLVERGGHMYAISPWIDALNSVAIDDAPLVGSRPTRIIKSHLPTALCPYNDAAKYIYVTRHPVGCFASIVDFNRSLQGPFAPSTEVVADWFCSDHMYWLPWPKHVVGWWDWADQRGNVLFVHFEDMKRDLGATCDRVAGFLGSPLTADERARVVDRSGFHFMKTHEEIFEMTPPTMFSVAGGQFLASGKASRQDDVAPEVRQRILAYCRDALHGTAYGARTIYSDLVR